MEENIRELLENVRQYMESTYSQPLYGRCIEGSKLIAQGLKKLKIPCKTVEGWCLYDDDSGCSNRPYDEHTWIELLDGTVLDVTMDQFSHYINEPIPRIYYGPLPYFLEYDQPTYLDADPDENLDD